MKQAMFAALVCALVAPALAQQLPGAASAPVSVKGVELKGKAPVNPQTLRVQLPRPQEATLSNGSRPVTTARASAAAIGVTGVPSAVEPGRQPEAIAVKNSSCRGSRMTRINTQPSRVTTRLAHDA